MNGKDTRIQTILLLISTLFFFSSYHLQLTALPLYVVTLGGSERMVGLLVGLFPLSAVIFRIYFGKFVDTCGRRPVLLVSIMTSITGPLLYLPNLGVGYLVLVRVYHSLSLAAFMTSCHTLLADYSTPKNRGKIFGSFSVFSGLPMPYGPTFGLYIVNKFGYQVLFLTCALVTHISHP